MHGERPPSAGILQTRQSPPPPAEAGPTPSGERAIVHSALPSFAALVAVFLTTRLLTIVLLRPGGFFGDWSDYYYFREMAALSSQGYYPYLHYWVEYPPVFPWLAVGAYRLSLLLPVFKHPLLWFQLALSGVLIVADLGNLWLVRRLGVRLWGESRGLECAWLYAGLFLPLYALAVWFDTLPTFFLLLGLELTLQKRPFAAGLASGIGVGVKLFPGLLIPVALRALRGLSAWTRLLLGAGVAILGVFLPFYFLNPTMLRASLNGMTNRRAWETVWALLDGYYGTGGVPALQDRLLYPESAYWPNPSRLPWTAITVAFAVVYCAIWLLAGRGQAHAGPSVGHRQAPRGGRAEAGPLTGPIRRVWTSLWGRGPSSLDARSVVALAGLTVALFLLYSRGFSQQFTLLLLPFVVLLAPGLRGALYATALMVNNTLVEGYLFVNLFPDDRWLLRATVGFRTLLIALIAFEALGILAPRLARLGQRLRPAADWSLIALAAALVLFGGYRLGEQHWRNTAAQSPRAAAIQVVQGTPPGTVLLFGQQALFEAMHPYTRPRPAYLVADAKLPDRVGTSSLHARLSGFTTSAPEVVLVLEEGSATAPLASATRRWLERNYDSTDVKTEAGVRLERFVAGSRPALAEPVDFGRTIALRGVKLVPAGVRAGQELRVFLYWQALQPPGGDYTVFVHLLDQQERIVAQKDSPPLENHYPSSLWQGGETVADEVSLAVPAELPAGEYRLAIGLYHRPTLERLPASGGSAGGDRALFGPVVVVSGQ